MRGYLNREEIFYVNPLNVKEAETDIYTANELCITIYYTLILRNSAPKIKTLLIWWITLILSSERYWN